MESNDTSKIMNDFLSLGKQLVLSQSKTHRQLVRELTSALIEEARLYPKLSVLYNDTFGGFTFSDGFLMFLKNRFAVDGIHKHTFCKEKRVELIPFVYNYGMFCLKFSLYISGLVYLYDTLHLEFPAKQARRSDLEFVDALHKYGERDIAIWDYQQHYDPKIIRFLIDNGYTVDHEKDLVFHPFEKTWFELDVMQLSYNAVLHFGLVCSSGEFSLLRIKEVPALVDWDITNIQGKEEINVLGWPSI